MDRPAPRKTLLVLASIVALAFLLRWPIAHRLLPQAPEPDAFGVLLAQDWNHDPALVKNWEYAQRYPKLLTYAFAALPEKSFDESATGDERLQSALACAAAPYQRARLVVLLLSLLALPLTWLVARRFVGDGAALIAVWLVATSTLHALFSTQGRPHGVHLTASLLAIWGALRLVEKPSAKRVIAAVVFAAIAMATLQNGVFTLIPLALAAFVSMRAWVSRIGLALLLPVAAAALAFTVYPVLPSIDATGVHLGGALSHNVFFSDFTFGGFAVVSRWFLGHDPVFAALTALGLVAGIVWLARNGGALIRGERAHVAIALAYVVPYSLLLLVSQDVYERFLLPLLPWFAIVAARPWRRFVDGASASGVTIAGRAVLALVLAAPLVILGRFAWVSLQPDTFTQAADWIVADPARRSSRIVATPTMSLPFLLAPESLERARHDSSFVSRLWFSWQLAHTASPGGVVYDVVPATVANERGDFTAFDAWLAERRPEFVVLEDSRKMRMFPALAHLHAWCEARGEIVHRSAGAVPDRIELGLADYQGIEDFARRLLGMRAFGPAIEIWRIAR